MFYTCVLLNNSPFNSKAIVRKSANCHFKYYEGWLILIRGMQMLSSNKCLNEIPGGCFRWQMRCMIFLSLCFTVMYLSVSYKFLVQVHVQVNVFENAFFPRRVSRSCLLILIVSRLNSKEMCRYNNSDQPTSLCNMTDWIFDDFIW